MANDIGALIAARAVQGAGAAVMMPLALTLLTTAVPAARRGIALGVFSATQGLAVAGGPLIGGGLTEHISWHWIFWLNVPIGAALLIPARFRLAESRAPHPRLDVPGTLLASAGLFGIIYGLVNANSDGWRDTWVLTGLIAGAVLLVAFVGYEQRAKRPMLPMRLFRNRAFSGINGASLLMFVGMFGSIFLLSQFLQGVQGYSPTEAGLRMLPWTGMPMIVAPIAGYLSDRIGGRPVVATGLALQAAGLAYFALLGSPDLAYGAQLPALIVSGAGMALYFAPAANLAMSSVSPGEQGIASGANNAMRELGGALGIAVLSSVFSANGGYASGQDFVDGLTPALWLGAGVVALAVVAALVIPRRRAGQLAPAEEERYEEPAAVGV
jgi:EmrB/QacA subfamily drug resistance transporter